MAKSFSKLRADMSNEAWAKSKAKADVLLKELALRELRLARGRS